MIDNYYGEDGCCLSCDDAETGCLCPECMCRQCLYYEEEDYPYFDHNDVWKTGRCTVTNKKRKYCKWCSKEIEWKKDDSTNRWIPLEPTTRLRHYCEIRKLEQPRPVPQKTRLSLRKQQNYPLLPEVQSP